MSAGAPDVLVGAGTVTSVRLAEEALSAGARFIVCPAWDEGVVDFCLERGLPVLPGTSGPDGVARAMAKGLEAVKLFPAEVLGGCAMLDALAGPFGSMRFVPTGGIDASNVGEYARRRQVLAIGGSWMARSDLIESGDWAGVERLCREAVFALHGFGLAHVGVNGASAESAAADAASFASLFGFVPKDGASSIFMSDSIELLKSSIPRRERAHRDPVQRRRARPRALPRHGHKNDSRNRAPRAGPNQVRLPRALDRRLRRPPPSRYLRAVPLRVVHFSLKTICVGLTKRSDTTRQVIAMRK